MTAPAKKQFTVKETPAEEKKSSQGFQPAVSPSTASSYRQMMAANTAETIKVTVPSKAVFELKKFNALGVIIAGELPTFVANKAAEVWERKGVGLKPGENGTTADDLNIKAAEKLFDSADRLISLSVCPKIVAGPAGEDELSLEEIADDDLRYLLEFVVAGGDLNMLFSLFPHRRPRTNALAGSARQK